MGPVVKLKETTRDRLLDASQELFVLKGFALTTVDEICAKAGATKGAFFHHFENKDHLGLLALERFANGRFETMRMGAQAWPSEPVGRLLAYVGDVRRGSSSLQMPRGCLIAIVAMELGATNDVFRKECDRLLGIWAEFVEGLVHDAFVARPSPSRRATPAQIAEHFIAVFEGSVVLYRTSGDLGIFDRNLGLFEQYLRTVLGPA
jgi:TetR/AcrR family transcriptional regulator, transcriptional repressor for nem operon